MINYLHTFLKLDYLSETKYAVGKENIMRCCNPAMFQKLTFTNPILIGKKC